MKYIYYIIFLLFCSCNLQKSSDNITELYIVLNDEKKNASDFIEKMEVIVLETNDNCLISNIDKVKYINEKLYILDRNINSLFVFNKDGSCDTILSKRGVGPGEYIQVVDFNVNDKYIQIMDHARSIKKYNHDLKFVSEIKFNNSFEFTAKDDILFLWNESTGSKTSHYISCFNTKNKETRNYLKMPFGEYINYWIGGIDAFVTNKNNLYVSPKFGNTIYYYADNDFYPIYKIKFNKNNFPENENIYEYYDTHIQDTDLSYVFKNNYYVSDKYLIFNYDYDRNRHFCFYDMITKELSNGIINNDFVDNFRFSTRWGNDNYLIEEVAAEYVINDFPSLIDFNEQLRDLKEDDNPIIIIYTLK